MNKGKQFTFVAPPQRTKGDNSPSLPLLSDKRRPFIFIVPFFKIKGGHSLSLVYLPLSWRRNNKCEFYPVVLQINSM
jgi:hypothetical protein